jgi:hypothetical protein
MTLCDRNQRSTATADRPLARGHDDGECLLSRRCGDAGLGALDLVRGGARRDRRAQRAGGPSADLGRLGWYTVDPSNVPPIDAQICTLVPKTDPIFNQSFHPQAGEAGQTCSPWGEGAAGDSAAHESASQPGQQVPPVRSLIMITRPFGRN